MVTNPDRKNSAPPIEAAPAPAPPAGALHRLLLKLQFKTRTLLFVAYSPPPAPLPPVPGSVCNGLYGAIVAPRPPLAELLNALTELSIKVPPRTKIAPP